MSLPCLKSCAKSKCCRCTEAGVLSTRTIQKMESMSVHYKKASYRGYVLDYASLRERGRLLYLLILCIEHFCFVIKQLEFLCLN